MEYHPTTNSNRITNEQIGLIEMQLNQKPAYKNVVKPVIRNGADYGLDELGKFLREKFNVTEAKDLIDSILRGTPERFAEVLKSKGYES